MNYETYINNFKIWWLIILNYLKIKNTLLSSDPRETKMEMPSLIYRATSGDWKKFRANCGMCLVDLLRNPNRATCGMCFHEFESTTPNNTTPMRISSNMDISWILISIFLDIYEIWLYEDNSIIMEVVE